MRYLKALLRYCIVVSASAYNMINMSWIGSSHTMSVHLRKMSQFTLQQPGVFGQWVYVCEVVAHIDEIWLDLEPPAAAYFVRHMERGYVCRLQERFSPFFLSCFLKRARNPAGVTLTVF